MNKKKDVSWMGFFVWKMFEHIAIDDFNKHEANKVLDHLLRMDLYILSFRMNETVTRDDLIRGWLDFVLCYYLYVEKK